MQTERTMIKYSRKNFIILGAIIALSIGIQSCHSCMDETEIKKESSQYAAAIKLKPKAREALGMVLSKGLLTDEYANEDIKAFLQNSSMETRYVMRTLTGNRCYLGDGHSILRLIILPNLCQDLDVILRQDSPSEETLDHAVWMASKLELRNLISFLVYMGAPANKYKLGD